MNRTACRLVLLLAASALLPAIAHAQAFRAYVASYGSDANPCTVAAPCRLLPAALNMIASGGEVWMLDSANFNSATVNVTKNVAIQAIPGQVGSIVPFAAAPAMILAPGVVVSVRNVSMVTNATNPGTDAIQMTTGILSVENSIFQVGNGYSAVVVNGQGRASVHGAMFRGGSYGIYATEGATVNVSSSKFVAIGAAGVYATATNAFTTQVTVRNCDFADNPYTSVWAYTNPASASAAARITVTESSITGSDYAVVASLDNAGSVIVSVGSSVISGNFYALYQRGTGAVTEVMGDNVVRNNTANTSGTITTAPRM